MSWCWAPQQILLFPLFCRKIVLLFVLMRPLWRENGPVICSAICRWLESRRTHNHRLLSHLRLLGSLSVASYDSRGLRWKYSYPPPHGNVCSFSSLRFKHAISCATVGNGKCGNMISGGITFVPDYVSSDRLAQELGDTHMHGTWRYIYLLLYS
jgi:hypothetical protein